MSMGKKNIFSGGARAGVGGETSYKHQCKPDTYLKTAKVYNDKFKLKDL